MKAVVIYESMYGNTHAIATAIADGLRPAVDEVTVVAAHDADGATVQGADLVVVGGPTHVHGMSRPSTRKAAVEAAEKPGSDLEVEADAMGPGIREWLGGLSDRAGRAAAFDTRIDAPAALTGRASKGIARRLRAKGYTIVADPHSFLVTKESHLEPHEEDSAREWGAGLGTELVRSEASTGPR
jgi:hypothetical protein